MQGAAIGDAIRKRTTTVRAAEVQGLVELRLVPITGDSDDEPAYRLLEDQTLKHVPSCEVNEAGEGLVQY